MARDNSPKERQQKQLERKQGRRASYDRILIVSEGSKTEPNYFREIRAAYRLHTANVEERWRSEGIGPRYLKICGRVLYRQVDIDAYEESCLQISTSLAAVGYVPSN